MFSLVMTALPDRETAGKVARELVDSGLAACAQAFDCSSVYRWKGRLEEASDVMLHVKTRSALVAEVIERIVAMHPYELPEVASIRLDDGHLPYLEWIADVTQGDQQFEDRIGR